MSVILYIALYSCQSSSHTACMKQYHKYICAHAEAYNIIVQSFLSHGCVKAIARTVIELIFY